MKAFILMALFAVAPIALAQDVVKPIPPVGKELPAADRAELEAGVCEAGEGD